MTDEVTDQASEQSVMERLASKFSAAEETETATAEVESEALDLAELEWDGAKYKVPVKLKDAFMKNDDYTKKTQELAEQRKNLDQVLTTAQQKQLASTFHESIQGETKELNVIDAYLAQATKVDWTQMSTDQMLRHKVELDQIKERRSDLQKAISEKQSKFQSDFQTNLSQLRSKARELASKSITDFSESTEKDMRAFAAAEGLGDREMDNVLLDARSFKIVWKAMQFDKIQKGTGKAAEAVGKVLKPGAASERMPAAKVNQLNFHKAMKSAKNSGQKAQVIETRLAGMFGSK
jgi:hypothetical protein